MSGLVLRYITFPTISRITSVGNVNVLEVASCQDNPELFKKSLRG